MLLPGMGEDIEITCPWCGEQLSLWIDRETTGSFVQDCDVCCRPWQVHAHWEPEEDGGARCEAWVERA